MQKTNIRLYPGIIPGLISALESFSSISEEENTAARELRTKLLQTKSVPSNGLKIQVPSSLVLALGWELDTAVITDCN